MGGFEDASIGFFDSGEQHLRIAALREQHRFGYGFDGHAGSPLPRIGAAHPIGEDV